MQVTASHRFAKISPRRVRMVADLIRGERVQEALQILRETRKRGSVFIEKVVRAAIASASENHNVEADELTVGEIWVDAGPVRGTIWARPRGMWAAKRHRTSHIHVVLNDAAGTEEDSEARA